MATPEMIPVESSNVKEIGYDAETSILYVMFKNNSLYKYFDVGADVWDDFKAAASKGQFVHQRLKGVYNYERVY